MRGRTEQKIMQDTLGIMQLNANKSRTHSMAPLFRTDARIEKDVDLILVQEL